MNAPQGLVDALQDAAKRDDDLEVGYDSDGELWVQTTEDLGDGYDVIADAAPGAFVLDSGLLSRVALEPRPDVPTRIMSVLYMSTTMILLEATLLALPLFLWPLPHATRIAVMCVSSVCFLCFFAAMVAFRRHPNWMLPLAACQAWAVSLAGVLGATAALADVTAPLALGCIVCAQHSAAACSIRYWGAKPLPLRKVMIQAYAATLMVWGLTIVPVAMRDEIVSHTIVLVCAHVSVASIALHLRGHVAERRYNTSWADAVRALIEFFAYPLVA